MIQSIRTGVSYAKDYVEHTVYGLSDRLGSMLQIISGLFLANTALQYANKQDGYVWSSSKSLTPAEVWVATPINSLAEYSKINPTAVAAMVFTAGSILKLMGRSSMKIKLTVDEAKAIRQLTAATQELAVARLNDSRALRENTELHRTHSRAVVESSQFRIKSS